MKELTAALDRVTSPVFWEQQTPFIDKKECMLLNCIMESERPTNKEEPSARQEKEPFGGRLSKPYRVQSRGLDKNIEGVRLKKDQQM